MRSKTPPRARPTSRGSRPSTRQMVDTAKYKKDGPYKICFSNAAVEQPLAAGRLEDDAGRGRAAQGDQASSPHVDAEGKDDKQISDIADLLGKGCDALIVSPEHHRDAHPGREAACATVCRSSSSTAASTPTAR